MGFCSLNPNPQTPSTAMRTLEDQIATIIERIKSKDKDLQLFFDLSTDILCIADKEVYMYISDTYTKATGWRKEEIEGSPWIDFIHPDDIPSTEEAANSLFVEEKYIYNFINRILCKDGTYIRILWNSSPDKNGRTHSVGRIIE